MTDAAASEYTFAVCVHNNGYPASLVLRKLYRVLPDPSAALEHYVRIIDESGEDYLYPEDYFVPVDLPQRVTDLLLQAA